MTPVGPGTLLAGRFRLEDLLEETDGARLWRATDTVLSRDVAVHVVDDNDSRASALLTAARTSATVTGAHLLRVLDAAAEDGVTYVVNEWGNGMSLDRMLLDEPLPARQAAWLVREVADGIADAHRHGVAHGRLLPENVVLTEAGAVKIAGLVVDAVLHGRAGHGMSDHEADVHDLAALLYVAMVGCWPGTPGSRLPAAPREHGRILRPRQVRAGVPRQLDKICDDVLNPGGADQVALETAVEVRAALSDFLGDGGELALGPFPVLDEDGPGTEWWHTPPSSPRAASRVPGPVDGPVDGTVHGMAAGPAHGTAAAGVSGGVPGGAAARDAEATQAGVPVFDDDSRATPAAVPPPDRPAEQTAEHPAGQPAAGAVSVPAAAPTVPIAAPDQPRPGPVASAGPHLAPRSGSSPAWPPEAAPFRAAREDDRPVRRPPGGSWLRLAALVTVIVLVLVGLVLAFDLGQGDGGDQPRAEPSSDAGRSPRPKPVTLAAVRDFDPFQDGGTPEENPDLVPLAHDGDPATAWHTLTYKNGPDLTIYKPGVGLLLDLGQETKVTDVRLTLVGSPTTVQLLAAPSGAEAPTGIDGLQRVANAPNAGTSVTLTPADALTTRYLVVWLTALPVTSGGYRGEVAEVVVRS